MTTHQITCEQCGAASTVNDDVVRMRLGTRKVSCLRCGGPLMFPESCTIEGLSPIRSGSAAGTVVYFAAPSVAVREALDARRLAEANEAGINGTVLARRAFIAFTVLVAVPGVVWVALESRDPGVVNLGADVATATIAALVIGLFLFLAWKGPHPRSVGLVGLSTVLCGFFVFAKVSLRNTDPAQQQRAREWLETPLRDENRPGQRPPTPSSTAASSAPAPAPSTTSSPAAAPSTPSPSSTP